MAMDPICDDFPTSHNGDEDYPTDGRGVDDDPDGGRRSLDEEIFDRAAEALVKAQEWLRAHEVVARAAGLVIKRPGVKRRTRQGV